MPNCQLDKKRRGCEEKRAMHLFNGAAGGARKKRAKGGADAWFQAKLTVLMLLMLADVLLNGSVEYDSYSQLTLDGGGDDVDTILVLVHGVQLLVQVAVLLTLFIMMFDTWPFKAGLMGLVAVHYKWVYAVNGAYITATALLYGYRLAKLIGTSGGGGAGGSGGGGGGVAWDPWDSGAYMAFSIMHKLGACVYYMSNTRAAFRLGDPMFYTKDAWVSRYRPMAHPPHRGSADAHWPTNNDGLSPAG